MIHSATWVLVEAGTSIFEILLVFLFLNGFLNRREIPFIKLALFFTPAFLCHFLISTFLYDVRYSMVLSYIIVSIAISFFLYNGKLYVRVFSPLLLTVMLIALELVSIFMIVTLFSIDDIYSLNTDPWLKLVGIITKNMLGLIAVKAIIYFRKSSTSDIKTGYRLILLIVPVISLVICYVILDLILKSGDKFESLALIGLLGILYVNILIFAIFEGFMRQVGKEYQYKMMEKQLDMQLVHYNQLAESRARIREIWHDFKNHVNCLKILYSNNDRESLGKYIDNLSLYGDMTKVTDTGNPVIDALLSNKHNIAEQHGINISSDLFLPPDLPISPADACVILGNSLDNAIEACNRIRNRAVKKEIFLTLKYQNGYLVYVLSNSVDEMPQKEGGRYKTWKPSPELHGLGMQSIERTVKQYNGNMVVKCEDGIFRLEILMLLDNPGA